MKTNNHPIQCKCGGVTGYLKPASVFNRTVCYCKDCQAFVRHLGHPDTLDHHNGTDVVQISQANIKIVSGAGNIGLLRLTNKGLYRWYAKCCQTPLFNTLPNPKVKFAGIIHSCIDSQGLAKTFGEPTCFVNTKSSGNASLKDTGVFTAIVKCLQIIVSGFFSREQSPLFDDNNRPICDPYVLTDVELKTARGDV